MATGRPLCSTRRRMGEVGSHSPIAANVRSASNTTARSPGAPSWLVEVIDPSYTQGLPPRIWRRASGVTRTAIRRLPAVGSCSSGVVMHAVCLCTGRDGRQCLRAGGAREW